jgi:hypothetical protein
MQHLNAETRLHFIRERRLRFGSQWWKTTLAYAYAAWLDPSRNSIDLGGRKRPFDDSIEQAIARFIRRTYLIAK